MYQRILIAQPAFLGDVILSTPLMRALRDRWPDAYVAAMVRAPAVPLLKGLPFLDDVFLDHPAARPKLEGWNEIRRRLRAQRFDLVVSPSSSVRMAALLWGARIPRRIGYR